MTDAETIADLREQIACLKAMIVPPAWQRFPFSWGLTGQQAQILWLLLNRETLSTEGAMNALYFDRKDAPEPKVIQVQISKIRRKVEHLGIEIEGVWGRGHRMGEVSKAIIREAIQTVDLPSRRSVDAGPDSPRQQGRAA